MTFASTIRRTAPLLLAATLAACVAPYGGASYSGGSYSGGSYYDGSAYSGSYYRGDTHAATPSRRDRIHRHDGSGDFRRYHRAPDRPGVVERHRRDHAGTRHERRRAAADRTGFRSGDRSGDRRLRDRAAERPVAERHARRAERRAQVRAPAVRHYEDYRGSGETGAAFTRRVKRARREANRESMPIERILAGGAMPEK